MQFIGVEAGTMVFRVWRRAGTWATAPTLLRVNKMAGISKMPAIYAWLRLLFNQNDTQYTFLSPL